VKAEGIIEVKSSTRDDGGIESREFTRLSSAHVVLIGLDLTPLGWIHCLVRDTNYNVLLKQTFVNTYDFKESNETKDLPLSSIGNGVPSFRSIGNFGEWSSIHFHRPWEVNSVGVYNVTNEGKHGNTS
jgi:hypothetical protein